MGIIQSIDEITDPDRELTPEELIGIILQGDAGEIPEVGGLGDFFDDLVTDIQRTIINQTLDLQDFTDAVDAAILANLETFASDQELTETGFRQRVETSIDSFASELARTESRINTRIDQNVGLTLDDLDNTIDRVEGKIEASAEQQVEDNDNLLQSLGGKIFGAATATVDAIDDLIDPATQKVTDILSAQINDLEGLVSKPLAALEASLPLQLAGIGDAITTGLGGIKELPDALTSGLGELFTGLASTLGLDQLLDLFTLTGKVVGNVLGRIDGGDNLEVRPGSWDMPLGTADSINIVLAAIPILGQVIQSHHPAEFERIRLDNFEHVRPTPLDSGSVLEFMRRFPLEADAVIDNLRFMGLNDERIAQLVRIRNTPLPVIDHLDAWHRGTIEETDLDTRLLSNGLSNDDIPIAKALSERIPPMQDQILFAVRGVYDVEESRAFGEFEGLPPELESAFTSEFGIEGGDFSSQVQVFADQAGKLGMSPATSAAYWVSHWRLPSLQTAYEMFHRLQPDIVEAESEAFIADGFNPAELAFDRTQLDRLVRSADFSEFWRPKLSAIAFNPLTRVDIRRMHKLGILDDSATHRAYRKVGFSPSDADKMLQFTIAFNTEPDQAQTNEVRDLTKSQILDFVENDLLSREEGIESLTDIGYSPFAAEGFVELELAKRDRSEQKQQIDLVRERVKAGLATLNDATTELDEIGVGANQKAIILRDLEIDQARKSSLPTKSELAEFVSAGLIDQAEYEAGLSARGIPDIWIPRYVAINVPQG